MLLRRKALTKVKYSSQEAEANTHNNPFWLQDKAIQLSRERNRERTCNERWQKCTQWGCELLIRAFMSSGQSSIQGTAASGCCGTIKSVRWNTRNSID